MKTLFAKLFGKYLKGKLKLEDKMDGTKKWYRSTAVWAGIYATLRGLYVLVQTQLAPNLGFHLPEIPAIVDGVVGSIVGGVGINGRVNATEKIG